MIQEYLQNAYVMTYALQVKETGKRGNTENAVKAMGRVRGDGERKGGRETERTRRRGVRCQALTCSSE
jgi:hypothetical protein